MAIFKKTQWIISHALNCCVLSLKISQRFSKRKGTFVRTRVMWNLFHVRPNAAWNNKVIKNESKR